MDSWWSLGEWSGHPGAKLALDKITCAFCSGQGKFSTEFHAEKKQPNGTKVLNFDTLKCSTCGSFVQVIWAASQDRHGFRVQPWPLQYDTAPDDFPEDVARYWLQAKRNLVGRNFDAASVMARGAVQLALRGYVAKGADLQQEINDLAGKGFLPPQMQEWARDVRELGNDLANLQPGQAAASAQDATDIIQYMDFLFEYLYLIPKRIQALRDRKPPDNGTVQALPRRTGN